MSAHDNVDLGHTVAGWTGTAVALGGFSLAGLGVIAGSAALVISGVAVIALAAIVTWLLHLTGWGKPSGPRPADQWDWRVKDLGARQGHPDCLGCRLAGRRAEAVAKSAPPMSAGTTLPSPRRRPHTPGVQAAGPASENRTLL
ncbi:HGxxPAAW family protein [Streptomyces griseorubiginosus]|uniref:HGxxPAAW family protein n=1 Tax=Streptomyces griseorubiginosus TaxID=67304 RepID=UPI003637D2A4